MLVINTHMQIPESELTWKFVRSGGPGGQNVNKVASKAMLFWNIAASAAVPTDVKSRLALQQKRFCTKDGTVVIASQKYRDQDRNRQDCLDKLRAILLQAWSRPKKRKATRPSRGSRLARLESKKHRAALKSARRKPGDDL
jgi:ribosome-associated protein